MIFYSYCIQIHVLGFDELLESIFCLLLVVEAFSLQKVVEIREEMVVSWREVQWIWQMRQSFTAQFVPLLKHWLCNIQSGIVTDALSVDQCSLQTLQFLVHFINLLSMLLGCNGFARIQKAIVDQTSRRPPTSDPDPFFDKSLALGSALEFLLGPPTELVITSCHIKSTFSLHVTIQSRNGSLLFYRIREDKTSKQFFWICSQFMRHSLIKLFHSSNLLQMPTNHRMVDRVLGKLLV